MVLVLPRVDGGRRERERERDDDDDDKSRVSAARRAHVGEGGCFSRGEERRGLRRLTVISMYMMTVNATPTMPPPPIDILRQNSVSSARVRSSGKAARSAVAMAILCVGGGKL